MNRRIILITIVAMTIALIGLMVIQIYWIQSASSIKEANFRRSVNEAMARVVAKVERLEKNKSMLMNQGQNILITRHLPIDSFLKGEELDSMIRLELNIGPIAAKFLSPFLRPISI